MSVYLTTSYLEIKRHWRNREALIMRLVLPTAIYLILTASRSDAETNDAPVSGLGALGDSTATMIMMAVLGAVIAGLAAGPALGEERSSGWLRQLRVTPLPLTAAVTAKVAMAIAFVLPAVALVVVAGVVVEGAPLGWAGTAELVGLTWLASVPFAALGTVIGLAFASEVANGVTTLTFLVLWLAGGIFTPADDMPGALAVVAERLPTHGVIQVAWSSASGDAIPGSALVLIAAWTLGAGGLAIAAWRRVTRG